MEFRLSGLTPARSYRLQLFMGETRTGTAARHGPATLAVAGETFTPFDFGPSSVLVAPGATAVKLTATFVATADIATVTLTQQVDGGGGLELAAFALHDVSLPDSGTIEIDAGGQATVSWRVVPGFVYSVWRSPDHDDWQPGEGGVFTPTGDQLVRVDFTDPSTPPRRGFYRLARGDR